MILTELHDDLAEVVGMASPFEESNVTHFPLIGWVAPELVFLHICSALHNKPNVPKNHACNVPRGPEIRLIKPRNIRRIEDRDGKRHSPYPNHLKDPEAEKWEEHISLVVEAVILSRLDDSEEQEAREPSAPGHDEDGSDDLASMVVAGECEGDDGEANEISSSGEV